MIRVTPILPLLVCLVAVLKATREMLTLEEVKHYGLKKN